MSTHAPESWGRYPQSRPARVRTVQWTSEIAEVLRTESSLLAYGCGRSYGDSCLNNDGTLVVTTHLDRFMAFDPETGVLRCEAGVTLADIIALVVPHGWFLPVTPGTKYVTIGGAIANDVHGKNHHRMGTFGRHVRRFELIRSDGSVRECSATEQADWYAATIGGLGLTGFISWAEIQLTRIGSARIAVETTRSGSLEETIACLHAYDASHDYTVAWIDCTQRGKRVGRGHVIAGEFEERIKSQESRIENREFKTSVLVNVPFQAPNILLNKWSIKAFNTLYYHRQQAHVRRGVTRIDPFFYPLDIVGRWNYLYGKRGFVQWQCVIPYDGDPKAMHTILSAIERAGMASFLAVLKVFGSMPSPGMLSFPQPGLTLALDFGQDGAPLLRTLDALDAIVSDMGGRIYPAKDARMSARHFRSMYANLAAFTPYIDPHCTSTFWQRVSADPTA